MNFGSLSNHADDKVISNIRERIQKQQRLRNQSNYNHNNNDMTINNMQKHKSLYSRSNDHLNDNNAVNKSLHIKKTAHQQIAEQNRPALSELTNTNTNNNSNTSRSLKNTQATVYTNDSEYTNQENIPKNDSFNIDQQNATYNSSDMDVESNNDSVILHNKSKSAAEIAEAVSTSSGRRVVSNESATTTTSTTSTSSTISKKEVDHLKLEYTPEDELLLKQAYQQHHVPFPDLNDPDTFDVTLCPEYQPEIFRHLRVLEAKFAPMENFMAYQPNLNWKHRTIVLNWLVYAHDKLKMLPETLYLTVNLFDRLLSTVEVTKQKLYLVAGTSLFIASKFEEINQASAKDIKTLLNDEFENEHIYLAETFILQSLNFDIGFPGPMSFLRKISKADNYQFDKRTLAKYLLETTIMDPKMVAAKPSWLAAGAYYLSMVILENLEDYNKYNKTEGEQEPNAIDEEQDDIDCNEPYTIWTSKHVYHSGYTERQIAVVASTIAQNCRNWNRAHEAVYNKYCSKKNRRCSLIVDDWLKILEQQRLQEEEEESL